jgi:hypothetical protein
MISACFVLAESSQRIPISVNGRIPLGIESFRLLPAKGDFYLMASAEDSGFIGMTRIMGNEKGELVSSTGQKVKFYPEKIQFRLTASARERMIEERPFDATEKIGLEDLLTKLRFRLKIFHGLDARSIEPAFVDDIGMPKNVPYDERIYRIGFKLGKVPIEDRVVMEVYSPSGERLCKFHLDLL